MNFNFNQVTNNLEEEVSNTAATELKETFDELISLCLQTIDTLEKTSQGNAKDTIFPDHEDDAGDQAQSTSKRV
jgi:hypothetical protein